MTTATKLTYLNDTKAAIKTAIEAKGVTVGDATFRQYADKVALIEGGGGPPLGDLWTPADIATSLWFDANDVASITKDGGGYIGHWADKSGNSRHATQTVLDNKPQHIYDSVLEKWVSRFDGNDFMAYNGTFFVNSPSSIFIAAKRNSNKPYNYIFGSNANIVNKALQIGWHADYNFYRVVYGGPTGANIILGIPRFVAGRYEIFSFPVFNDVLQGYRNGAFVDSVEPFSAITAYGAAQYLGRATSNYCVGDILEIIVCNYEVAESLRLKIEGYLAHKWGIELPNSPYYEYAPRV